MKKIVFISLLALSATAAFAEVKPFGTPVPYLCSRKMQKSSGPSTEIVAATQVCRAKLTGMKKQALIISLNDGTRQLWEIRRVSPLAGFMHDQVSWFELSLAYSGQWNRDGEFERYLSGSHNPATFTAGLATQLDGTTLQIKGKTPGNVKFDARDFEFVATTL